MFKKTIIAATFAMATLTAATAGAASLNDAGQANGMSTPTFEVASSGSDYERCARFSISVYNACLETAAGDTDKVRSCRQHYEGNVVRCQALNG
jgi:hypothetical protein